MTPDTPDTPDIPDSPTLAGLFAEMHRCLDAYWDLPLHAPAAAWADAYRREADLWKRIADRQRSEAGNSAAGQLPGLAAARATDYAAEWAAWWQTRADEEREAAR